MSFTLEDCVGDVSYFLENTLSRHPLYRPSAFSVENLPITVEDIDDALMSRPVWVDSVRVAKDNDALDRRLYSLRTGAGYVGPRDVVDPLRLAQLLRSGATVVLRPASLYIPALKRFCKEIEKSFGHGVDADVFITPANARGFEIHSDAAESLAIQLSGTKHWTLYEPIRPLEQVSYGAVPSDRLTAVNDVTMEVGDFLYVPRGMPHLVRTGDSPSVHLTISVNTATWPDLLSALIDVALRHPDLKQVLPMGADAMRAIRTDLPHQLELLRACMMRMVEGPGLDQVVRSMDGYAYGLFDGIIPNLLRMDDLSEESVIRQRPGSWPVVDVTGEGATVQSAGNRFRASSEAVKACEILESGPTEVSQLAADPESALEVARVLLRIGVAEVVKD
jgi:lysine-specific demethylase/histidyl-hydroxylase NO66